MKTECPKCGADLSPVIASWRTETARLAGLAGAASLTPQERSESARRATLARSRENRIAGGKLAWANRQANAEKA